MSGQHFISYPRRQAEDFALKLADVLQAGPPPIPIWLDARELPPGRYWGDEITEAIRDCESLLFVMTPDSVRSQSVCTLEWTRALKYKKPIVPLRLDREAEMPFRLEGRQYIDFANDFKVGLAQLRSHLRWLASPEGELRALKDRLEDAERDLELATEPDQQKRIQKEIDELEQQIAPQQRVVENPEQEEIRRAQSIQTGMEREREPEKRISGTTRTKFINPPPLTAPTYFQDRHVETKLIGDFLKDEALRFMTVVGRAGIGKTAMVCRLLKSLESGRLPNDGGELRVDGIVYLSERGSRGVSVPYLYTDLCELLEDDVAEELDRIYRDPQASIEAKMHALLDAFPEGRYVLLLDNFEDMIDPATRKIKDAELKGALRSFLEHPHHAIKVIVTTRYAPERRELALVRPGLQRPLNMDKGLPSPYAENILREMDADGTVGLKTASDESLAEARERTRGIPRGLEALFAILSSDRDTSLREVLDDTKALLPEDVVEVLVGEAFSRLDPVAQMVMQALAIYGYPVTPAAVDYVLLPHRTGGVDSAAVLGRLVNMQFARREAGQRYYLHPVDREYALTRVPKGEANDRDYVDAPPFTQFALLDRAADYLAQTRTPRESWKTIEDLAAQLQEFELRFAGQDYDTAANVLLEIDFDYLRLWGHFRQMTAMHERLRGKLSDPELRQSSLGNLGTAYISMGRFQEGTTYYEQSLAIAREMEDRVGEGAWLGNLGNSYDRVGRYQEAIAYYEQALEIFREIGDRASEGLLLGNLGTSYDSMGRYQEAIAYYEQSLAIAREVEDRVGESNALGNLGLTYGSLGRTREAIDYIGQSLAIAREVGDRASEGSWLGNLGTSYDSMGRYQEAIAYYEQSLAIAREVENRASEGKALGNLGTSYSNLGRTQEVIAYYEQALEIAREIDDRASIATHLSNLGDRYADQGQHDLAKEYYEESLSLSRDIGYRYMESANLLRLGYLFIAHGEWDEAVQQYQRVTQIADEIGNQELQREPRVGLAYAYLYAGDLPSARTAIDEARQYESEGYNYDLLALGGVIALRMEAPAAAKVAFQAAVAQAEAQLSDGEQEYRALDSQGLALCGLALATRDKDFIPIGIDAYRKAREIIKDRGIVDEVLRLFDALKPADSGGILAEVRVVAAGTEVSSI